jgi:hypothetical protein
MLLTQHPSLTWQEHPEASKRETTGINSWSKPSLCTHCQRDARQEQDYPICYVLQRLTERSTESTPIKYRIVAVSIEQGPRSLP